jgi:hypothetical protein
MKREKEYVGYGCNENCIEWIKDTDRATLSLSQRRMISKIEKLANERPDECEIIATNTDGSICAHVPRSWIKISPKKQVSEENKLAASKRMSEILSRK